MDLEPRLEEISVRCPRCGELVEVELHFGALQQEGRCTACSGDWLLEVQWDEWGDPTVRAERR